MHGFIPGCAGPTGAAGMISTVQRWCWHGDPLELTWEQHQDIDAEGRPRGSRASSATA